MAAILATVDIEDLATAKVKGIKDALTDLVQTQQQLAASNAALASGTAGVIASMGASATTTGTAAKSLSDYVAKITAAIPAVQQAATGIAALGLHIQNHQAALQGAAQLLTMYGGGLAAVAQAARTGAAPLQAQASALAELADAAKDGVVGLKEHAGALNAMMMQVSQGVPLTKAQADALEEMAVALAAANRETLSEATALQTLAAQAAATTAAIKDNYSSLTLLTSQLKEGTTVTKLQADALKELSDAAQAGNGFTKEQAATLAELSAALQAGVTLTAEQAAALEQLTAEYAKANAETLGYKTAVEEAATAVEQLLDAHQSSVAVIRQNAEALALLSGQMKEGAQATDTQITALRELADTLQTAGFNDYAVKLRAVADATEATGKVGAESADTLVEVSKGYSEANKAALGFKEGVQEGIGPLLEMNKAAAALATVFGLLSLNMKHLLEDSINVAARSETLGVVMGIVARNSRLSYTEMNAQVEAMKKLGITTIESQEAVIKFVGANLKLADSAKVARAAQDLAVVGGVNSSQAYDRLTRSIEAQSAMMLRSFGIVTSVTKIYEEYAQKNNKVAKELTDVEKRQAFVNKILAEGEKVAGAYEASLDTAGKMMSSFARYVEEAKKALGEALLPTMLVAVKIATELEKAWLGLSPATQAIVSALAAAGTAMTLFASIMAGAKFLGITTMVVNLGKTFIELWKNIASGQHVLTSLQVAFIGINPWVLAFTVAIGLATAAYILWNRATKETIRESSEQIAKLEAQNKALDASAKKYTEAATAVTKLTAEHVALDKASVGVKNVTKWHDEHASVIRRVAEEQEKLNKAQLDMVKNDPAMATVLQGQTVKNEDLAKAIDKVKKARQEEQLVLARSVLLQVAALEKARDEAQKHYDEAVARQQKLEQRGTPTMSAFQQAKASAMTPAEIKARFEAELATVRGLTEDAVIELADAINKVNAKKAEAEAALLVVLKFTDPAAYLAKVRQNVQAEYDAWVLATKNAAERLKLAGKEVTLAMILAAPDPQAVRDLLAQVDKIWDDHVEKQKALAKQIANARESVRKLAVTDPVELAKYDELNKVLGKLTVGTEEWWRTVNLATPILNQFGHSAEALTGKMKANDEALRRTNKYLADFIPQSTIDDFKKLETALSEVEEGSAEYFRVLEEGASLVSQYSKLTEGQAARVGTVARVYKATAAELDRYYEAQLRLVELQTKHDLEQSRMDMLDRYRDQLKQLTKEEEDAAKRRRDANIAADEAIYQSHRQMEDTLAQEKLKGDELLKYQTQRQIEALLHRYETEKAQRDLAIQDEERAVEERIRLAEEEIRRRIELAIRARDFQIRIQEEEARSLQEQARIDPRLQREADLAMARAHAARDGFAAFKRGMDEQRAEELRYQQEVNARLRATVAANKKAADEISAKQKTLVDDQIKQILKLADAHTMVAEMVKEVWSSVAGAFSKGLLDMLKDGKTFTQGMAGLWKNNLEPALKGVWERIRDSVFGIMDEMLKGWINNLLKMKTATKASDIFGSITGGAKGAAGDGSGVAMSAAGGWGSNVQQGTGTYYQPGGAGYVGTGETGGARMGAGRAGAAGGVMGGVIGAQIGYGVGGQTGSYGKGIGAGMASGAAAGAAFGAVGGPVGAAIGAGIGAIIGGIGGWFGAKKAHAEARKARDEYISGWAGGLEELKKKALDAGASMDAFNKAKTPEQVAKAIQDLEKAFKKLDEALAVKKGREDYIKAFEGGLDGLKKRAEEAGISLAGLMEAATPKELQDAIDGLNQAFEELEKREILAKAKKDLATTYTQMLALSKQAQLVGYDLSKLYNAETIEEFNKEQEKLNQLLKEQQERLQALSSATTGLATWATGFSQTLQKGFEGAFPKVAEVEEFYKKFKEAQDRGFKGTALDFSKHMKLALPMEEFVKIYQEYVDKGFKGTYLELARHLQMPESFLNSLKKTAAEGQDEFQSLGITAAASFAAIVKETGDLVGAMNQLAPTLDQLIEAQDKWGFAADESFSSLIQFRRIIKDNQDVFNSISGLTQALKGLTDANALTEESFDAMGRTAVEKYNVLKQRTGDAKLSLLSMQPTLQALWEAQKKFGFTVDEGTQALINQGIEQGLVGANMQSVDQKMLDVLGLIAKALGVTEEKLGALGLAGETAGAGVTDGMTEAQRAAAEAQRQLEETQRALGLLQDQGGEGPPIVAPEDQRRLNDMRDRLKLTRDQLALLQQGGLDMGTAIQTGTDMAVAGLNQVISRAEAAAQALFAMGVEGERAGRRIEIAAGGAAEGHSPTGIKAIVDRTLEAHAAMTDFTQHFVRSAKTMEDSAAAIAAIDVVPEVKFPTDVARQVDDLTRNIGFGDTFPIDKFGQMINDLWQKQLEDTKEPVAFIEPTTTVPEGAITVQVTQEGAVISVSALDNANMDEAWRNLIMPAYMKHLDNNADQIAERTESAIIRYRRRVG